MRIKFVVTLLVSVIVMLSASVMAAAPVGTEASASESNRWLARMGEAFATQNYNGVFVYTHGSSMDTMRIIHRVEEGVERERIVRLDGPKQEIIREDGKVTCVHGSDWNGNINHKIPLGPFARAFVRDMSELGDSYQLVEKGKSRVAGRDAQLLLIQPRDDYRYGYNIWLDQETGLLLKSILVHRGKVLERFQFTQLNISDDIDEAELDVGIIGETMVHYPLLSHEEDLVDHKALDWNLDWLPEGFEMRMQGSHRDQENSSGADTITFTDGMAAFSVFIERITNQKYEEVTAQKGATVAVTRIVNYPAGDHLVTVVGEVPMKTAKRIALSVVPSTPALSSTDEVPVPDNASVQ
ncbi:MAG: MucB/RseB C-terminal domain-containing protein [Pseudomonadales bacterium]